MNTKTQFVPVAIHIQAPRTAHILGILDPTIAELDYDTDLHNKYIVFDYPKNGKYVILTPKRFRKKFAHCKDAWFFRTFLTHPA